MNFWIGLNPCGDIVSPGNLPRVNMTSFWGMTPVMLMILPMFDKCLENVCFAILSLPFCDLVLAVSPALFAVLRVASLSLHCEFIS